jgi:hypothetical protein
MSSNVVTEARKLGVDKAVRSYVVARLDAQIAIMGFRFPNQGDRDFTNCLALLFEFPLVVVSYRGFVDREFWRVRLCGSENRARGYGVSG